MLRDLTATSLCSASGQDALYKRVNVLQLGSMVDDCRADRSTSGKRRSRRRDAAGLLQISRDGRVVGAAIAEADDIQPHRG